MARGHRWTITEYGPAKDLVSELASSGGVSRARARDLLDQAGQRAGAILRMSASPLSINGQAVRAADIAGLITLAPGMELEIAPKFLGASDPMWREDFFYLAMLSRHGQLLSADRLRALASPNADLSTLVARALVQMYWEHHRRPIRTYKRRPIFDFAVEGDIDPEALWLPDPEGFPQTVIKFDRANHFNAALSAAVTKLMPVVRDHEVKSALERIAQRLGSQSGLRDLRSHRLPSRYRQWSGTYDLALDVLKGFGLTYASGGATGPGYVADTWRLWENLVTLALGASGEHTVYPQRAFTLGTRQRGADGPRRDVRVWPDVTLLHGLAAAPLLVDAKYKGRADESLQRISEADIYEAIAFCLAADAPRIVLLYPRVATSKQVGLGQLTRFETVRVAGREILGVDVEVRGISRRAGLRRFIDGLLGGLPGLLGVSALETTKPPLT